MAEPCEAGLITLEDQLHLNPYADTVARGMIQMADELLGKNQGLGVRELTYAIADNDVFLDVHTPGGEPHRALIWGPSSARAVAAGEVAIRDLEVIRATKLKTSRLALAVAICATRDCDFRGSCQRS